VDFPLPLHFHNLTFAFTFVDEVKVVDRSQLLVTVLVKVLEVISSDKVWLQIRLRLEQVG